MRQDALILKDAPMLKDGRLWSAIVGFGIGAWLLVPQLIAPRAPRIRAEDIPVMDYICRDTKEVFRLPAKGPVLPHPQTGKATLVPAVYDARAKTWKPGLPLEVRQLPRTRRG
jgi:hypothetical protein